MQKYQIDRLEDYDWVRLKSLRLRSVNDAPEAFGSSLESMKIRPDEFWSSQVKQMACFVAYNPAQDEKRDVGLVRGVIDPQSSKQIWLLGMWIDPVARGHGLGERLTHEVFKWGRSLNTVSTVKLEVVDNNTHAIALYERLGFTLTGRSQAQVELRSHTTDIEYEYLL